MVEEVQPAGADFALSYVLAPSTPGDIDGWFLTAVTALGRAHSVH